MKYHLSLCYLIKMTNLRIKNWMLTAHCSIGKVYDHQHHFQTLVNACWYSRCPVLASHFNLFEEVEVMTQL